ncbi:MAG TPA: class I SAM-dependent methyltransferase [Edaphobacter sp.]|nr:class I SAM-dependent methyltransferase [Edaphobacter sp.]
MRNHVAALELSLLKTLFPKSPDLLSENNTGPSKISLLGERLVGKLKGKTVIDFGCGHGAEAIHMAQLGAARVIGIDIQQSHLNIAKERARQAGVEGRCAFATSTTEPADIIVSIDAFEHFADPAQILDVMHGLLKPGGEAFISFGPTWFHPLGGHLFSVFPWAHLLFSEKALIQWRSTFKNDGATRFHEVAGGLNQITIKKFNNFVSKSNFDPVDMELVPIQKLRPVHNRLTREFTTALVRAELVKH